MNVRKIFIVAAAALPSLIASAASSPTSIPGVSGPSTRYATDCYPGFDKESEIVAPSKKEPRWFQCILGPKYDNAKDQFAWAEQLVADGSYSKAARAFDAIVRNWPVSPEAPKAQQRLAEIRLDPLDDSIEAFEEYRYLIDFYAMHCDYSTIIDKLYKVACLMRKQGKEIMFFHFDNTVDVRRAFEACVLRAPGATWVREAMLTIGELRMEEGKPTEAVKVYENLRNLYQGTAEARAAYLQEARARMEILDDCPYNRTRTQDTIDFLQQALRGCELKDIDEIRTLLAKSKAMIEDEAYRSAVFYDSRTRTPRSAINAYERFLAEYPESSHKDEINKRLEKLREKGAK